MKYFFKSIATFSFWRYALFSREALAKLLAVVGSLYLLLEILDFFGIYTRGHYGRYAILPMLLFAVIYVIFTRRPVSRVIYKVRNKDYAIEVKIGDLFDQPGDVIISTNTTFDTDIASGLISSESLQGQLALKLFQGQTADIDRQLDAGLAHIPFTTRDNAPGKKNEYPIGTTAKVTTPGKIFYFVAMSRLNEHGTASSSVRDIEDALDGLWRFIAEQGEMRTLNMSLMGTGRGRIELPRKKMIERIAQSFADASREKVFSNKLVIVIRPQDAESFGVNLFEVRDYLLRSLHT
jgi:hypothetical protein